MIKITGMEVAPGKKILVIDNDGALIYHILQEGMLEAYMGCWGLPAGATLTALIADAVFEEFVPPLMGDVRGIGQLKSDIKKYDKKIAWGIDRDQALADITLAEDDAELVRSTWEAQTAAIVENPPEPVTMLDQIKARRGKEIEYAASHQRLQEERLADEFVSSLPAELRSAPRAGEGPENPPPTVGLAIQFVP